MFHASWKHSWNNFRGIFQVLFHTEYGLNFHHCHCSNWAMINRNSYATVCQPGLQVHVIDIVASSTTAVLTTRIFPHIHAHDLIVIGPTAREILPTTDVFSKWKTTCFKFRQLQWQPWISWISKESDLESDDFVVDDDLLCEKVGADRRLVLTRELVIDELVHQRRLANSARTHVEISKHRWNQNGHRMQLIIYSIPNASCHTKPLLIIGLPYWRLSGMK